MKSIGQKIINVTVFGGLVNNLPILFQGCPQKDFSIFNDPGRFSATTFFEWSNEGVSLASGDKENIVFRQFFVPNVIIEAVIKNYGCAFWEVQSPGPVNLVAGSFGHINKRWKIAIGIKSHMQFDRPFVFAKRCPGKNR